MKKYLKMFTLFELLIVIWIIAVLSTAAYLTLIHYLDKSRDSRQIKDLKTISTAFNINYTVTDSYPTPSSSIQIMDQNWKLIWEQWYLDEIIIDSLPELTKSIKDPTTQEYYMYTRYNNNKWFELWTMLTYNKSYSLFLNKTFWDMWTKSPYIIVNWNLWFCDSNWELMYPKPISLYDSKWKEFINSLNLWPEWKVFYNLNYLKPKDSSNGCNWDILAPISNIYSNNEELEISQIIWKYTEPKWLDSIIDKVCEDDNNMCNKPNIYKINYNMILLFYTLPNWNIVYYELFEDNWVYKKSDDYITIESLDIMNNDIRNIISISSVSNSNNPNTYQISYINDEWNIWSIIKTMSINNLTTNTNIIDNSNWALSSTNSNNIKKLEANGKSIIYYTTQENWKYVTSLLVHSNTNSSSFTTSVQKLPFECNLPEIIYLEKDLYMITYIWWDWKIHLSQISLSNSNLSLKSQSFINLWAGISNLKMYFMYNNIYLITYTNSEWKRFIATISNQENSSTLIENKIVESKIITNFKISELWWWKVLLSYNLEWKWKMVNVLITQDWKIIFLSSDIFECNDMNYQQYSLEEAIVTCDWETKGKIILTNQNINTDIDILNDKILPAPDWIKPNLSNYERCNDWDWCLCELDTISIWDICISDWQKTLLWNNQNCNDVDGCVCNWKNLFQWQICYLPILTVNWVEAYSKQDILNNINSFLWANFQWWKIAWKSWNTILIVKSWRQYTNWTTTNNNCVKRGRRLVNIWELQSIIIPRRATLWLPNWRYRSVDVCPSHRPCKQVRTINKPHSNNWRWRFCVSDPNIWVCVKSY